MQHQPRQFAQSPLALLWFWLLRCLGCYLVLQDTHMFFSTMLKSNDVISYGSEEEISI